MGGGGFVVCWELKGEEEYLRIVLYIELIRCGIDDVDEEREG